MYENNSVRRKQRLLVRGRLYRRVIDMIMTIVLLRDTIHPLQLVYFTKLTRMRGKAQPDGRPAIELTETPVLRFASCGPKYACNAAFQLTKSCRKILEKLIFITKIHHVLS